MDPLSGQQLTKFPGRISDADPSDIPPGAFVSQDNWESLVSGRLTVRKGFVRAVFTNETGAPGTGTVIALHRHHFGVSDTYLYQLDDGSIHVGLGPLST